MNTAYQTMRNFWLDVKNLQHKQEVPQLGEQKICIAGVELAAADGNGQMKHILIVASSLGNASVYFENNSPSGIGGFTGGAATGTVREKAQALMQAAAVVAGQLPLAESLPVQNNPQQVTLFTVSSGGKIRAQQVAEQVVRDRSHILYGFFAYTQQLLGAFRAEQEAAGTHTPPTTGQKDISPK